MARRPGSRRASAIGRAILLDIDWNDGKVTRYRIVSPQPRDVTIRVNGEVKTIKSEKEPR